MWVTLSLRKKELKAEHTYYQLEDLKISRKKRQLDRRKRYEQSLIMLNQKRGLEPLKTSYDDKVAQLNKGKEALNAYLAAVKKVKNGSSDNYYIDGSNKNKLYIVSDGGSYISENDGAGTTFYNVKDLELQADGNYYNDGIPVSANKNSTGNVERFQLAYDLSQYDAILKGYGLDTDLSKIDSNTDISSIESTVNFNLSSIQTDLQSAYTDYMREVDAEKLIWENELEMKEQEVGDEETELELEQNDIESQMEFISNELEAMNDAVSKGIQQSTIKLS